MIESLEWPVAVGLLVYVIILKSRPVRDPVAVLVRRLQGQWGELTSVSDATFARRIIRILTTPTVKEAYELTITVDRMIGEAHPIRVEVQSRFDFRNVGAEEVTLHLGQGAGRDPKDINYRRVLESASVDDVALALEKGGNPEIRIPAGERRSIRTSAVFSGDLPYIAFIPQKSLVRAGTLIHVISRVHTRVTVMVTGYEEAAQTFDSWWVPEAVLRRTVEVTSPLLPHEAIIVTVGVK
jgi:hypothetical protein